MARVVLITTGMMEEKALAPSLTRIFPEHDFVPRPHLDGFTGATLPPDYAGLRDRRPLLNIEKFAKTLIGLFAGGRRDEPRPDFVVALEDVELLNAPTPERITQALRDAVAHNLSAWQCDDPKRGRLQRDLQTRCSFHLMAPMTEAYFFADRAALARATASAPHHPCCFDASIADIEAFHVDDPSFLCPPTIPKRDRERHDWRTDDRQRHPKRYLEYLTDAQLDGHARYQETIHGVSALAELDWPAVVRPDGRSPAAARFARSLLIDLVDMLGSAPQHPELDQLEPGACHPLTWPPPGDNLLRNL